MAKLYGKGTIKELVPGKKYRIDFSAGRDPKSGRVYLANERVPDNAYAIDDDGKGVCPRVTYGKATEDQKRLYGRWKTPVKYLKKIEVVKGTRRQAELRTEEIRRELMGGKAPDADTVAFSDWCEKYLTMRENMGKLRRKTLRGDRTNSRRLVAFFGSMQVVDITPVTVDDFTQSLISAGVGKTTVRQCFGLLRRILEYAVAARIIFVNPCQYATQPANPRVKRRALSRDEVNRLVSVLVEGKPDSRRIGVLLGVATGARLGEVLGLTWGRVMLDGKRPHISIVYQLNDAGELAALKTDDDDNPIGHVVPLDTLTVKTLRAWRRLQKRELAALGMAQGDDTPVVTDGAGGFFNHANYQRWWRAFMVEQGFGQMRSEDGRRVVTLRIGDDPAPYDGCIIEWRDKGGWHCDAQGRRYSRSYPRPKIKKHYEGLHFHEMRHTFFTQSLASGVALTAAQHLGGWTTTAVLTNTYLHETPEDVWLVGGFLDRISA